MNRVLLEGRWRRRSCFGLILALFLAVHANAKPLLFDGLEYIEVNSSKQCLLIRCRDLANPVLLYLHGGPGESLIPFAHVATSLLTDRFTVVYWDQRGAGLSYHAADPPHRLSLKQLIADTLSVSDYLQRRFGQDKIYLLGHSWGTTLGSLVIQTGPQNYAAYIGVGQVVNQPSLNFGRLQWLTTAMKPLIDTEDLTFISKIKPFEAVPFRYIKKYHGLLHNVTESQIREIMASSPYSAEKYTPQLYSQGSSLSREMLWPEIEGIDLLKQAANVPIPVFFFLGRYDYCTPTAPVIQYFEILSAPHKEIIWFENSGHRMDVEEPARFQQQIIEKLLGERPNERPMALENAARGD